MKIENTNLEVLAHNVAASLGLTVRADGGRCYVHLSDEAYFFFRLIDHARRIEVCGNFHLTAKQESGRTQLQWFGPNSANIPTITVSVSRSSDAIAKEIKTRFLPDYEAKFAAAASQRDSRNTYLTKTSDLKAEINKALGEDISYRVSFETHGDTASFRLSGFSRDNALKVAAFLKTLNA